MFSSFKIPAVAIILSGILIPTSLSTGIIGLLPEWVSDDMIIAISFWSILSGLFLLDKRFEKFAILFTLPVVATAIFYIQAWHIIDYYLAFINYATLWLLMFVHIYLSQTGKHFILKPHQWIGICIIASSIAISLGNNQIGAVNSFINWSGIHHEYWGLFIGIPGMYLVIRQEIKLIRTVLNLSFVLIIQYIYIGLHVLLFSESKEILPYIFLSIYMIGKIAESFYAAFDFD